MKFLTYRTDEGLKLGIGTDRGVLDAVRAAGRVAVTLPVTMEQLLQEGREGTRKWNALVSQLQEEQSNTLYLDESELDFGPCVTRPGKILCVGLNYRDHAEETGMAVPQHPILFNKFHNGIAAHGDPVPLPSNAEQVDYEAELAIVIGQTTRAVEKEDALDHVFGYCVANDLSARDLQFRTSQWLLGKCLDHFCPIGPYLVTADEVGDPGRLGIRCQVNGDIRQDSNTSEMIFSCAELISYLSQYMTLEAGDIILTGTPAGVIAGAPPEERRWLQAGDEVSVEIEKLGRLTNRMTAPKAVAAREGAQS